MFLFSQKPLNGANGHNSHHEDAHRTEREALQPLPPPKPFSVAPQPARDLMSTSILDGRNGEGLVLIGKGTNLVGEISNCTRLEIEGQLEGHVAAESVVVRAGGRLTGSLRAERAEVHGVVQGQVQIHEHLDIRSTGQVCGELAYGKLSVAAGGYISGSIEGTSQIEERELPTEAPSLGIYLNGHHAHPAN